MARNMWMVHAGESAFIIDGFKKKSHVAIRCNNLDDLSVSASTAQG